MSYSICRKFRIDAGHRVYKHEGQCANIHGHSYTFEVTAVSQNDSMDDLGRITDFGVLKAILGDWLNEHWDHAMLLFQEDPIAVNWVNGGIFHGMKYFIMDSNPTAENLAKDFLSIASYLLHDKNPPLDVVRVVCHETPNCSAEATKLPWWADEYPQLKPNWLD